MSAVNTDNSAISFTSNRGSISIIDQPSIYWFCHFTRSYFNLGASEGAWPFHFFAISIFIFNLTIYVHHLTLSVSVTVRFLC